MPKNKFQDAVFTAIMAAVMVYGMIVYNVAWNTDGVSAMTFLAALHEMPIMFPIAFVLEFFIVGKLAAALAFRVMRPDDRPQLITFAISICICCIMCPVMSLIATVLFNKPDFCTWVQTWARNFPMAICYQLFYCGPLVRLIFRTIFRENRIIRFKKAPRRVFSRAELLHFIFTRFPFPAKNQFLPKVPRPQKETPHRAAPARLQQE